MTQSINNTDNNHDALWAIADPDIDKYLLVQEIDGKYYLNGKLDLVTAMNNANKGYNLVGYDKKYKTACRLIRNGLVSIISACQQLDKSHE